MHLYSYQIMKFITFLLILIVKLLYHMIIFYFKRTIRDSLLKLNFILYEGPNDNQIYHVDSLVTNVNENSIYK